MQGNENMMLAKLENMGMSDVITTGMVREYGTLWNEWWPNHYVTYLPTYTRNSFESAFKIVSMMIEKGYLEKITLKKFIALIKEVEAEL